MAKQTKATSARGSAGKETTTTHQVHPDPDKSATPDPYKKKLAEVRKDLATLIAKLRTHGIHVDLDRKADEGDEV